MDFHLWYIVTNSFCAGGLIKGFESIWMATFNICNLHFTNNICFVIGALAAFGISGGGVYASFKNSKK